MKLGLNWISLPLALSRAQRRFVASESKSSKSVHLSELAVGDRPESWKRAGFSVGLSDSVQFGDLSINLTGLGTRGITSWSFDPEVSMSNICDIPVANTRGVASFAMRPEDYVHANGVHSIDHIVVKCGDVAHAESQFNSIGMSPNRKVTNQSKGMHYLFYKTGSTIIEVVCPIFKNSERGFIWGITFVTPDIDATYDYLKPLVKTPWNAVQPGRRIMTLNTEHLDISVKMAFISPHKKL